MQTSGREQFEEQWKNAFEGSEAAPSDKVWLSVEGSLANAQNDVNKRRVVYYQRLAAALLFLCAASALVIFRQADETSTQTIANNTVKQSPEHEHVTTLNKSTVREEVVIPPKPLTTSDNSSAQRTESKWQSKGQSNRDKLSTAKQYRIGKNSIAVNSTSTETLTIFNESSVVPDSATASGVISSNVNSAALIITNENEKQKPLTEEEEKAIVKKMLADAGVSEQDNTEEKKIILKNPAWISVGASGGGYTTQAEGPSSSAILSNFASQSNLLASGAYDQTIGTNKPASLGTAYSFGFMVGKPLSKRWLLQTGLTYVNRRSDYESNIIANGDQVFSPQIINSSMSSSYSFTNAYAISSTTEFLSVPVQVGFVIIDKKIGWILNSGISGDVFLKNTLVDKSGTYKLVSQSDGDGTAYRTVSWSGLASTEVTLRLSEHYRFALVPGLRYSITNIVKDESGYAKPLTLDIGFRFRYTF
ncbi:hypothetical protein BH09BAC3_BH09BAC3_23180 [soil metagenome]